MTNDPNRDARDAAAMIWHQQAVAAGQTERMLVRAVNGELVSYLPEEYGVARMTHGNSVTSAGGNWALAWSLLIIALGVPAAVAITAAIRNDSYPGALWLLPVLFIPAALYFMRSARREVTAVRLRRERGLPAPTSQTIESKWTRGRMPNGA